MDYDMRALRKNKKKRGDERKEYIACYMYFSWKSPSSMKHQYQIYVYEYA
jgi:hypothetical protein